MKVLFINNDGGGFAENLEVEHGTQIGSFFAMRMEGASQSEYMIRVNKQMVPPNYVLQDGDRVSVTPVKIHGA